MNSYWCSDYNILMYAGNQSSACMIIADSQVNHASFVIEKEPFHEKTCVSRFENQVA